MLRKEINYVVFLLLLAGCGTEAHIANASTPTFIASSTVVCSEWIDCAVIAELSCVRGVVINFTSGEMAARCYGSDEYKKMVGGGAGE